MGAPLDAVQVDALLDHLPQRAHVQEVLDVLSDLLDRVIDFFIGGEPAQTKADQT